ncbi:MAG TPA: VWA domain-containing protein [Bryobacteraceae bacterium]|nr:VWA domain-containing protein [Bryobacteraceae bacterium]
MSRRTFLSYDPCGRGYRPGRRWGNWCLIPSISLLLVPSHATAQNKSSGGEFRISTDVELVLLDVSVKQEKGGYVSGLSKDNFQIYENGTPQKIAEFASADIPVAVGLVFDDSGSMRSKRPEVVTAGLIFVGASNPQDQIFVVNFNDKVRRGLPETVPFTDNINLLRSALSRDMAEGQTALYDAIAFALKHLEFGRREKKTLVVVSDGGDNVSTHSLKELMDLIQESRATIYTVGIFEPDDPDRNPQVLERIARVSGGESFLPKGLDEVVPICRQIAKDIRNRYTIGYIPDHGSNKAVLRKIHVVATAPDRGKLVVRTRTSYLLPARSARSRSAAPVQ